MDDIPFGILGSGSLTSAGAATRQLSTDSYLIKAVVIQCAVGSNTVNIGNATRCDFQLVAGASLTLAIDRLDKVYVNFPAGGGTVNWLSGRV